MISIDINEQADAKWDKRLLENKLGTIHQTQSMGIYFKNQGLKPLFLTFSDGKGRIIGQLLVRISNAYNKISTARKILNKVPRIKKQACFWNYAPIIFDSTYEDNIYSSLSNFLKRKNYRIYSNTDPLSYTNLSILSKYFQIKEWSTYLIDLRKSKDDLYNNIAKHNGRKNIERSIKRGVIIEEINEKSLVKYHELRNETKEMSKHKKTEFNQLLDYWKLLKPLGYSGFLAKKNDIVVGGLLFSFFNKRIIEGGVARSFEDTTEKLYSQDLIKWKIIEWGVENKMNYYDLAGFNPNPQSKKEEGIKNYKAKWGGKQFNYVFLT